MQLAGGTQAGGQPHTRFHFHDRGCPTRRAFRRVGTTDLKVPFPSPPQAPGAANEYSCGFNRRPFFRILINHNCHPEAAESSATPRTPNEGPMQLADSTSWRAASHALPFPRSRLPPLVAFFDEWDPRTSKFRFRRHHKRLGRPMNIHVASIDAHSSAS